MIPHTQRALHPLRALVFVAIGAVASHHAAGAQDPEDPAGWPAHGGDAGGQRYSHASQIDRKNVSSLARAWSFNSGERGQETRDGGKTTFEATPILFDGRLVFPTAWGTVHALEPATGHELWRHDAKVPRDRGYSEVTSRGVAGWAPSGSGAGGGAASCSRRLFYATIDARLIALDSTTGAPCAEFGEAGTVDLRAGIAPPRHGDYQVTSPPAIAGDLVVVGSSIGDNWSAATFSGAIRGFDARTGRELWRFDPLAGARPPDAQVGAANAWAPLAVDAARGLVLVPTSSPSPDFFGGLRPGDGRWANSLVALRAATGEPAWGYQTVHHDLWDYDLAAQPTLTTVELDGVSRDVVVQATKMGFVYVLDRESGEPLSPVVERQVPASPVAGERASATQPFPTRPGPLRTLERFDSESVWAIDAADRESCRRLVEGARYQGTFTPPSLEGTILFPGNGGGTRWGGVAVDPNRGWVVLNSMWTATLVQLVPRDELRALAGPSRDAGWEIALQAGTPYAMRRIDLFSERGIPCTPPPWGTLAAIDLASGERVWEVALGSPPADHPLALHPDVATFGLPNAGGPMVTAGELVFIAATREKLLRAFDLESGRELWRGELPYAGIATPMTYTWEGRQYVVIAAGGHGKAGLEIGDAVVAFSLP
ncbi:MAG TPA: pyrroloquinoline quinone-dependent dehydrogenase [Thermoanaerobaculia bacterium]|nr:pyrroloquinoline quinone-dependent dehydrogenase [Thermoanaerobaculia bacterium]